MSHSLKTNGINSIDMKQVLLNPMILDSVYEIEELSQDISLRKKSSDSQKNVEILNDPLSVFEYLVLEEEKDSQENVSISEESENIDFQLEANKLTSI